MPTKETMKLKTVVKAAACPEGLKFIISSRCRMYVGGPLGGGWS
jgi:hypothetical protein